MLINRLTLSSGESQPNMIVFDIQTSQVRALSSLAITHSLNIIQEIPVVTMRIEQINGKTPSELKADSSRRIPRRAFEGELRVTFRDTLSPSEKITAGVWEGHIHNTGDTVHISLDEQYARRTSLKIGDRILFNVQGMLLPSIIGSLREVDWRRLQTNFRIIFPTGVLEQAPQFHVLALRVSSKEQSAIFQKAAVHGFPNVSIIDLGLVLQVLEDVLDKISLVIRFMAAFSIITGFIVLLSSILTSKYQRIQEMVLLRTLGASRKQLLTITMLEYFFLGSLASATGIFLSLIGFWALAKYSFEMPFSISIGPVFWIFISVACLTVLIGLFNAIPILNKPPLEILRKDP
jgi:putative ABC transport system permease protein